MKNSAYALLRSFSFVLLFPLMVTACRKAVSPEQAKQQRVDWNLKTTVDAYDTAGFTNVLWDSSAQTCLKTFATVRGNDQMDATESELIASNAKDAVNAGCKDPLVNYLYIKFAMPQTNSKEEFAKRFYQNWQDMCNSSYPPVRKCYAGLSTLDQIFYLHDTNSGPKINDLIGALGGLVQSTLSDKSMPAEEAGEVANRILYLTSGDNRNEKMFYDTIEAEMSKNWPDSYTRFYARGNYFVDAAWAARGNGTADTVTSQGAADFASRLREAQAAYERAWKLDPTQSKIAIQMITVMMGEGGGRDRMEVWFNRAMQVDTNCYDACSRKLRYLAPQWYGSPEDLIAFGRECVHSTNWGGRVPLILVDAHDGVHSLQPQDKQDDYWKRPEVWADIQAAFDRFFELNPDATSWYHNYAWYAYHAEQWDKLNELIPKLGEINYDYFGGRAEYNKMVELAKEHRH